MSHIFLYGPPGTGKSTIGKILARNLNLPFVDVDRVVEANAGMFISQIMEEQGEAAFRDMETAALKNAAAERESVIALGGGALLREENRAFAEMQGTVVLLMAELDTLLERLKDESGKRPLLAGDMRAKLTVLLDQRRAHYSSFAIQYHVDGKTAEQNASQIQIKLGRFQLRAMGEYDVLVEKVEQVGNLLYKRGLQSPIVVTDENVAKFHAEDVLDSLRDAGFIPKILTIPAGEDYKNLETIQKLWHGFLEHGLDRKSTVIALGGGVVGDMTGFAAATYMRGINWVGIPTTLLSMVDASLGGKTGFDLPEGKNLIGSFYPPKLVLADPQVLKTLPERELISGLAEVVKHGIISDPELFDLCARGLECIKEISSKS
jgi:3-dehydroquinate synthetase